MGREVRMPDPRINACFFYPAGRSTMMKTCLARVRQGACWSPKSHCGWNAQRRMDWITGRRSNVEAVVGQV